MENTKYKKVTMFFVILAIGFLIFCVVRASIGSSEIKENGTVVLGKVKSLRTIRGKEHMLEITYEFNNVNYTNSIKIYTRHLPDDYDPDVSKSFYIGRLVEIKVHKDYPSEFLIHKWK